MVPEGLSYVLSVAGKAATQKMKLKDDVPKRSDRPLMGLQSGKNFVSGNVKEAAAALPKYKSQQQVRLQAGACPSQLQTIHDRQGLPQSIS
jgi:hypothetical protein